MKWALLLLWLAVFSETAAAAATFKVTLLTPADDPRFERARLERALLGHPGGPAVDALRAAFSDSSVELGAAASKIELLTIEVSDAASARAAATAADKSGASALLADLPAAWLLAAADAAPRLPLLNIGHTSDALREADCRTNLLHLLPSQRMRADAMAQTLIARRWNNVLLLVGPLPEDKQRAAAAEASIKRYGLKLVASKTFKLSADPRERELANPLLLTQGIYDVVWVVDSDGEFAATLPYRTTLPRPVVGDGGLMALAWSARFERYGAPQISRGLARATRRQATEHDWAAWMAGKALVAAAVASNTKLPFAQALASAEIDGSKGVLMNFRPWDGQLRQPILLSDGQSVITLAPAEGVLHPKNNLDTLGADAPEKLCKARL